MAVLFSIVAVPFYVPTSSAQRFQFHILVNTCYFLLLVAILLSVRWYHLIVICIFLTTSEHFFHRLVGHVIHFLWRNVYSSPFFKIGFLDSWIVEIFCSYKVLWILTPYQIICKCFLPFCRLPFDSCWLVSFDVQL